MNNDVLSNSGIYRICNIINNKSYIGSAVKLSRRKQNHFWHLDKNSHDNVKLQNAYNKYGIDNFKFELLLICEKKDLIMYEQRAIDIYDSVKCGYNIRIDATSNLGIKYTEEAKSKMSLVKIGHIVSDETKQKISKALTGYKHTEETKRNMSLSKIGTIKSPEACEKLSRSLKGRIPSEQCIFASIKSNKARIRTDEERKKISQFMTGNSYSLGKHWYTNGIINTTAFICPEGFIAGKTRKSIKSAKGTIHYNNGIVNIMARECPEGFVIGMLKRDKQLSEQSIENIKLGWIKRKQRKAEKEAIKCL